VSLYLLLKAFHVLFIVSWVGIDVGLFASSFWIRNPKYSIETRLQMGRLGGLLDMGPRSSMILILAAGTLLLYYGPWGFGGLPVVAVWALVALFALWLWAVWQQFFTNHAILAGHDVGWRMFFVRGFRTFDLYLRGALATAFIVGGALGASGMLQQLLGAQNPIAGWLNLKFVLFGLVIAAGIGIRFVSDDFVPALGAIARNGSTPELEARLSTALRRAYPWVIGLWTLIVIITIVAETKVFA
jgi:hypothetical protein